MRCEASSTTKDTPNSPSVFAAARPAAPAPTIATSVSVIVSVMVLSLGAGIGDSDEHHGTVEYKVNGFVEPAFTEPTPCSVPQRPTGRR